MIFEGRIVDGQGAPVERAKVEMVAPAGRDLRHVASGKIEQGVLSLEADPGPIWGLRIDGRPIVATIASSDGDRAVNIGEIVLSEAGVAWPMFHAPDGRVFGLPRGPFIDAALDGSGGSTPRPVGTRGRLTFGAVLGSSAQQLATVTTQAKGLQLVGANVTIKGVPTATDDAIGLEFPNAELAAAGTGLSELSFVLRTRAEPTPEPSPPAGATIPSVIGYTRELVIRKLAALGLAIEVRDEITTDEAHVGRVVRQVPKPGEPIGEITVLRIFIGKRGAA